MPKEVTIQDEDIEVIETTGVDIFEAQERASINSQIATARKFPRTLKRVLNESIVIATFNKETALTCRYAKPVGTKTINGASVHLARIICQQYGNIRVQQRIKSIEHKVIVAEAVAFDLETNYAVCVEARRSIIKRDGTRYDDSTIETNAMAVMAIAERNAIFKIIPKSIIDIVYAEAFKFAYGDLSDNAMLLKERNRIFNVFKNTYAMSEQDVIKCIGLNTKEAVTAENIADLQGYLQSLKDKEFTVEDLLKRNTVKPTPEVKKVTLKKKQATSSKKITTPPEMP
ncbi:MAG: hypothetical protein JZU53_07165 [Paludibacter sp.]|nr:hypothetical protein [Paludibacter sp.]